MFRTVFFIFIFCFIACKNSPTNDKDSAVSSVSFELECVAGGGDFLQDEQQCQCSANQIWDDKSKSCQLANPRSNQQIECEDSGGLFRDDACTCVAPQVLVRERCENLDQESYCFHSGGKWLEAKKECGCLAEDEFWDGAGCTKKAVKNSNSSFASECRNAGGKYDDPICDCGQGHLLVGSSCRPVGLGVNKEICENAFYPGVFIRGRCECQQVGEKFSPFRGGCQKQSRRLSAKQNYNACKHSLNQGTYIKKEKRCECLGFHVYDFDICHNRDELSSRRICASDHNLGRWDNQQRVCHCPMGYLWMHQNCRSILQISHRDACIGEFNQGNWRNDSCVCPDGKTWNANLKLCVDSTLASMPVSDKICLLSGGSLTEGAESCKCSAPMHALTIADRDIHYCAFEESAEIPQWLQVFLGIF